MGRVRQLAWMPVNTLYGAATAIRRRLYRAEIFRSHQLPIPVISVGNISAGGTGKTPLVIWLAENLAEADRRICVISRGYGRANPDERLLVSDGERVLADAKRAGDEPVLLAESLIGRAAVFCDRDRVAGTYWAVEHLGTNLAILDDGFQHFRLARSVDLVTIDASRPFAGLLREGIGGLRRADAIILARVDLAGNLSRLVERIGRASGGRPVFTSRLRTTGIRPLVHGKGHAIGAPLRQVGAFCGVGNPDSFFELVRRGGFEPVYTRAFHDHANYSQAVIDGLCQAARAAGAGCLITTAKDEVKLRGFRFELPGFVMDTALKIDDAAGLLNLVRNTVALKRSK